MKRFAGRNAVVTGASRGIGAAIAQRLAAEGCNVVIVARTLEKHDVLPGSLKETLEVLKSCPADAVDNPADAVDNPADAVDNPADSPANSTGNHSYIVADMADAEARAKVIPKAREKLGGPVHILVNNAAAAIYQPLADYPLRRSRLMMEINFHAPLDLSQSVLPDMRDAGEGWIVNLSSGSANLESGPPFRESPLAKVMGIYGASKAALNRMTNAMAVELYDDGIRVNTVEPKAAVLSPGADIKVGEMLAEDQIESMEAMVEGAVFLCDCERDFTGRVCNSLDLIEEFNLTPMNLDGNGPYPGGIRPVK